MTPPRSGLSWRTCRRSVRHPRLWPDAAPAGRRAAAGWSSHSSGTMPAKVAEQSRRQAAGPGGPAAPSCPPSAQPPAAPPVASHACPASPQHPGRKRPPARSRPPTPPRPRSQRTKQGLWSPATIDTDVDSCGISPCGSGLANAIYIPWVQRVSGFARWPRGVGVQTLRAGRIGGAGMQPGLRSQYSHILAGLQRRADGCWPLPSLMLVPPWCGQGTAQPGPAAAERTCGGGGRPGGGGAAVGGG